MSKHAGRTLDLLMSRAYDSLQGSGKKKIDYDCIEDAYTWLGVTTKDK
jgi:hypothetical protein